VAEDALTTGIVATVLARDPDGDKVHYRLASDADGMFKLDGDSLVLVKALDYETGPRQYTLTIEAEDGYGGLTRRDFTLTVTNVVETTGLTRLGTPRAESLVGENGNDLIYGLGKNDVLQGWGGNDMLFGGAGKDVLTGGDGSDIFVFNTKLAKTNASHKKTGLDKITDFVVADDTVHLAKQIFSKIAKKGVLKKDAFYVGAAAHDGSDRVIYNKKTGALFYDQDGNGAHEAIQIATLSKNLKMTYHDFFVI
jgi:Ca2+-binding RTX toxin-like protein